MLSSQTSVLFSSDPDISLINASGVTVRALEVKGGIDCCALERYGAAKKSFEQALSINADAQTILVASCITHEVHDLIERDSTISVYYNLTEILSQSSNTLPKSIHNIFSLLNI